MNLKQAQCALAAGKALRKTTYRETGEERTRFLIRLAGVDYVIESGAVEIRRSCTYGGWRVLHTTQKQPARAEE